MGMRFLAESVGRAGGDINIKVPGSICFLMSMEMTTSSGKSAGPAGQLKRFPQPQTEDMTCVSACHTSGGEWLVLNVGGVRHETTVDTLKTLPNSRLGRLAAAIESGEAGLERDFKFDRNPLLFYDIIALTELGASPIAWLVVFIFSSSTNTSVRQSMPSTLATSSILNMKQVGKLHITHKVCYEMVQLELDFWQIEEDLLKPCCQRYYRQEAGSNEVIDAFEKHFDKEQEEETTVDLSGWGKRKRHLRIYMERLGSSRGSKIYGALYFFFVLLSIVCLFLETIPEVTPRITADSLGACRNFVEQKEFFITLLVLDGFCFVFFAVELFLRLLVSKEKGRFFKSLMNVLDLIILIQPVINIIFETIDLSCDPTIRQAQEYISGFRTLRAFRLVYLVKNYKAMTVLIYTLKTSLQELTMIFILLSIACVLFSTLVLFTERNNVVGENSQFKSSPMALWRAIITMTTVGYGDVTPSTPFRYVVGAVCAMCGMLLFALTLPILSNNFSFLYGQSKSIHLSPRTVKEKGEERQTVAADEQR
ncbi:hypothetical protein Btru_043146 [Bulinus truncatus]|nr:hypothetical protein Btru_043146 [Bulinus truncatus]